MHCIPSQHSSTTSSSQQMISSQDSSFNSECSVNSSGVPRPPSFIYNPFGTHERSFLNPARPPTPFGDLCPPSSPIPISPLQGISRKPLHMSPRKNPEYPDHLASPPPPIADLDSSLQDSEILLALQRYCQFINDPTLPSIPLLPPATEPPSIVSLTRTHPVGDLSGRSLLSGVDLPPHQSGPRLLREPLSSFSDPPASAKPPLLDLCSVIPSFAPPASPISPPITPPNMI